MEVVRGGGRLGYVVLMECGFGALGMSDRGRRCKVPTDRRDTANRVRSIPLITANRVCMQIGPRARS
jgi:hypothetical protein